METGKNAQMQGVQALQSKPRPGTEDIVNSVRTVDPEGTFSFDGL